MLILQRSMLVTDFDFIILRAQLKYKSGDLSIKEYHFERSDCEDDLTYLKDSLIKFWNNNILAGIEPAQILPELYVPM